MEKFYVEDKRNIKKVEAKKETIDFLLNYSKALKIEKIKGITYEGNLN